MSSEPDIARLRALIHSQDWPAALAAVCGRFPGVAVFSTSFGLEDQAILHAIAQAGLAVRVVTLDTGRLFEETHALHAQTRKRYGVPIDVFFPEPAALRRLIAERGPNGFRDSIENRRACCRVRKWSRWRWPWLGRSCGSPASGVSSPRNVRGLHRSSG